MLYTSFDQLIGNTPLLELTHLEKDLNVRLLAKLEYRNPAGSVKDRAAKAMLDDAQRRGLLSSGGTVIEPTSGNTGIGLAAVAAVRGYKCIIVMPDSMSAERRQLMAAYGAEVVLTPGALGMSGAIARAKELAASIPGSFLPDQFGNPANAEAHYETTGPELLRDTEGALDIFVAGVGTGGTVTGTGKFLKEHIPGITVAAVEPAGSPVLSGGKPGPHGLQGIGAGFIPAVLDPSVYDLVLPVTEEAAKAAARRLARQEGILVGISSGAALAGALALAKRPENRGKTIAVLLPDTGERYLSTDLFA